MMCDFVFSGDTGDKKTASCVRCGRKATVASSTNAVKAQCRAFPAMPKVMLGDTVSRALAAIGVSKEAVSRFVGKDCGCGRRASRLNEWGLVQQERAEIAIYEAAKFLGIVSDHGVRQPPENESR